jgi:cell division protein FtsN
LLDAVRDIRFSTVFLVSIIVLGTLIVVWLLIPDLGTGPTPLKMQPQTESVSSKPLANPGGSEAGAPPKIVVEVAQGSSSESEVVAPPERPAARETATAAKAAPGTQPTGANPVPASPTSGRYFLQAGAFAKAGGAEARLAEVQKLGFVARFEHSSVDGTVLTRVLVGPFETGKAANDALGKLAAAKIESFLRKVE